MSLLDVVHHDGYTIDLPPAHPFPMRKFAELRAQLDGGPFRFHEAPAATRAQLEAVHDPAYLDGLAAGTLDARAQRRSGFKWQPDLFSRCTLETGGTCRTVELALDKGLACNAAGGTHHAHRDFAAGYCLLNDLAVAVHHAWRLGAARVLLLDCDVHQGDGSARLLAGQPGACTVSFHCGENFPARKAVSDCDIVLPRGCDDAAYLAALRQHLPALLDYYAPDLVIYDAGVDVHAGDRLGHMALTDDGLLARDRFVVATVRGRGIPLAGVIGGGYDQDIARLAARHAMLFTACSEVLCATRCA